jgi:hypothetical protein
MYNLPLFWISFAGLMVCKSVGASQFNQGRKPWLLEAATRIGTSSKTGLLSHIIQPVKK